MYSSEIIKQMTPKDIIQRGSKATAGIVQQLNMLNTISDKKTDQFMK